MAQNLDEIVDAVAARIKARLTDSAPKPAAALAAPPLSPTLVADKAAPLVSAPGAGGSSWKRPTSSSDKPWLKRGGPVVTEIDRELARKIDHTQLRANSSAEEIAKLCKEAREYGFYSVCVNSTYVSACADALRGSTTLVCAVVGFPLGAMTPSAKAFEAREAVRQGAGEIDMVLNIGAMKSRDYATVLEDIREVVKASAPSRVKVILETSQLSEEEKAIACALSKVAKAAFVKTSTGFGGGGATVEDIALMKRLVGPDMEVKASGGVRTRQEALAMVKAGATRIGASASIAIVTGQEPGKGGRGY